jgi:hypothetical protein
MCSVDIFLWYIHLNCYLSRVFPIAETVDPEAAEFAAIAEYFHGLAAAAGKKFG